MRNYVREIIRQGDSTSRINKFHWLVFPYLAKRFFPDKETTILEIGVGSGCCILPLKKSGYKNIFAIDIDQFNLSFFSAKGIKCLQADASKGYLPFKEESIDVVILFHLIEHLIDAEACLIQIARVLKKEGLLVLSTPDWRKQYKQFFSDPTHIHPYDKKAISWLLRCSGFDCIWIRSFGVIRGLGRFWPLWKFFKPLMFTGFNILVVAYKSKLT